MISSANNIIFGRLINRSYYSNARVRKEDNFDLEMRYDSATLMAWEEKYVMQTYHPIPVVFDKAEGINVWDPEGKRYMDFLSAYSAVNQGHCHPKIISALVHQSQQLTLSSRAFYNSVFPKFARYTTELFGYERMNPMNSGAEAVETALKIARRWGHLTKGIPENEAIIITCEKNFHGRTIGIISSSSDPNSKLGFGPLLPGFVKVPYNNANALAKVLENHGNSICGFLVEPIQGEAGVIIPEKGYLKKAYALCKKNNVLFLGDEIQTGLGRTGKMLCTEWESVRPDILILGKALSGGVLPLSCVMADNPIMSVMDVGSHGSTYGGNPLASAVGLAALQVIVEEELANNALEKGARLFEALKTLKKKFPFIHDVRGKGLLAAIEIDSNYPKTAWDLCLILKEKGLLAKPTHDTIIRLAPPLVIDEDQLEEAIDIIEKSLEELKNK